MTVDYKVLKDIALQAGELLKESYHQFYDLCYKEDASPVTSADVASQRLIIEALKEHYPHIPVVAEEEGRHVDPSWSAYFLVDPLDGTKEFVAKTNEFCVLLAYVVERKVQIGLINVPMINRLFYAIRGEGAYEWVDDEAIRLRVSAKTNDGTALVSRFNKSEHFIEVITHQEGISAIKECGSALKGCLVAAGEAELYLRWGNTYKWDTGAMDLLVEEAGGEVLQLDGNPIDYDLDVLLNSRGLVISNGLFGFEALSEACKNGYNTRFRK